MTNVHIYLTGSQIVEGSRVPYIRGLTFKTTPANSWLKLSLSSFIEVTMAARGTTDLRAEPLNRLLVAWILRIQVHPGQSKIIAS